MESRIACFSENPSRYAYLVPGSTPLSVAKTAIECLDEMTVEDTKLFAPIMIVSTVMRTSALKKFISRPEYATVLPIIRMHFSLNGKINLTAIKLVGHCCLAANIRSANPLFDKVRDWIGGQDVWKMDPSKCKIFPEIMDEITKTVLIFSEQEAVINGIKINRHIRIRQGKEIQEAVQEADVEEVPVAIPEPTITSEPIAAETLSGYPPMPSFPSVSAFALPPASALRKPEKVAEPEAITKTFQMPQLHTITQTFQMPQLHAIPKPPSISVTQTPSVTTALERLKGSLFPEKIPTTAAAPSAQEKSTTISKEQAILTEPAIPESSTLSFTMPVLTPRMITQMKGKTPMTTMSPPALKPPTAPLTMPTTFPARLPFLGARAIRPSAPLPIRSAFRVPLSISTDSPNRRRQRSPTSEPESQPARKRSSVSPSESASSGSSIKLPPKALTDLTVTIRPSLTPKETEEQLLAFQKLTDEMDYGYEKDVIPLAEDAEPIEVAMVAESEKAEEKKDDDDTGTDDDDDNDDDEDDDNDDDEDDDSDGEEESDNENAERGD